MNALFRHNIIFSIKLIHFNITVFATGVHFFCIEYLFQNLRGVIFIIVIHSVVLCE